MARSHAGWLRQFWHDPASGLEHDPSPEDRGGPHRRLLKALAQQQSGVRRLGAADLVALLRAVVRQETAANWGVAPLEVPAALLHQGGVSDAHWQAASMTAVPTG